MKRELNDLSRREYEVLLTLGFLQDLYPNATGDWARDVGDADDEDEALTILAEECSEVTQMVCKIKRFGLQSNWTGDTNQTRLSLEIGDVLAMVDILVKMGIVHDGLVKDRIAAKKEKLKRFSNIPNVFLES